MKNSNDKIALIGVVVAVIAIIAALTTPEIRGFVGLEKKIEEPKPDLVDNLITDSLLQGKLIVGKWKIRGESDTPPNMVSTEVEGEIEFKNEQNYDGIFNMTLVQDKKPLAIAACKMSGKWKNGDIDYESPASCDCTYKSYKPEVFSENKLKKSMSLCKDGKFLIAKSNSGAFDFTKGGVEFYKNKIIINYKNYEDDFKFQIILDRIK